MIHGSSLCRTEHKHTELFLSFSCYSVFRYFTVVVINTKFHWTLNFESFNSLMVITPNRRSWFTTSYNCVCVCVGFVCTCVCVCVMGDDCHSRQTGGGFITHNYYPCFVCECLCVLGFCVRLQLALVFCIVGAVQHKQPRYFLLMVNLLREFVTMLDNT